MSFISAAIHKVMDLMTSPLKVGDNAPDFALKDQNGNDVILSSFQSKTPVILYFYPKDDTPGCTAQACTFRDLGADIDKTGATLLGISSDNEASHQKFAQKYDLSFPLLADTGGKVAKAYGVSIAGGIAARYTFVIDQQGVIREVIHGIDPSEHPKKAMEALYRDGLVG